MEVIGEFDEDIEDFDEDMEDLEEDMEDLEDAKRSKGKAHNILFIWELLKKGAFISKARLSDDLEISTYAVQRCIRDINNYLEITGSEDRVAYKYSKKGYVLGEHTDITLIRKYLFVLYKALIESRSLKKEELQEIINSVLQLMQKSDAKIVENLISSDVENYVEPRHGKRLLDSICKISQCIQQKEIVNFNYEDKDSYSKNYTVKPISLVSLEKYYYVIAFAEEDETVQDAMVFRLDRIFGIEGVRENFEKVVYQEKLTEEEFRDQLTVMSEGELEEIELEFYDTTLDSILDILPSAEITKKEKNDYIIKVKAYGDGIINCLLSKGCRVKVLKPEGLKEKIKNQLESTLELYK